MKVAITIWEKRISPVFDASHMLLVTEIENEKVINSKYITFNPEMPSHLTETLTDMDVDVLICGAVSEMPANMIEAGGIKLIPFIAGYADKVLEFYVKGNPIIPEFLMPGCGCKHRRRGRKKAGLTQKKGESIMPRGDGTGPKGQRKGKGLGKCNKDKAAQDSGQGKGSGRGSGKRSGRGQGRSGMK